MDDVFAQAEDLGTRVIGQNAPVVGVSPALVLLQPKYARNVGTAVRNASCYGLKQVWYTGDRLQFDQGGHYATMKPSKRRLPREERMKCYQDVEIINFDRPFDQFVDVVPVAIEVRKNAEPLHSFVHPENAVYVFGPEDGGIDQAALSLCHRFVVIPTRHCLNLAVAVATVLYDRQLKAWMNGRHDITNPGQFEHRGYEHGTEV